MPSAFSWPVLVPSALRATASVNLGAMRHRRHPHRTLVKHAKHFRARLVGMPKENFRGVVRGSVARFRNFVPGSARRMLSRRIDRLLALYESRFGKETFVLEIRKKMETPLPRFNWLPGGFAYWRSRITGGSSGSPSAPAER